MRCYLDIGYAQEARDLIERRFPDDHTACFTLAKVLIEYLAVFVLKEEGETEESVDRAMDTGLVEERSLLSSCHSLAAMQHNPYAIWTVIHHSTFTEAIDHLEEMAASLSSIPPGGPLEALQFLYGLLFAHSSSSHCRCLLLLSQRTSPYG